jgi:hypothetical protein
MKAKITHSNPFERFAFATCEDGRHVILFRNSLLDGVELPLPIGTPIDILKLHETNTGPRARAICVTLDRPLYT